MKPCNKVYVIKDADGNKVWTINTNKELTMEIRTPNGELINAGDE